MLLSYLRDHLFFIINVYVCKPAIAENSKKELDTVNGLVIRDDTTQLATRETVRMSLHGSIGKFNADQDKWTSYVESMDLYFVE